MLDFDIQRCTRRCAATDRELRPGEVIYSVLVPEGSQVVRLDYSEEGWQGPPENTIGFWKFQLPDPDANKVNWAPNEVMLDYFLRLENDEAKRDVRFVLALLLMRRRVLRLDDAADRTAQQEVMILHCPRNDNEYRVPVASPSGERVKEIQDELAQLLFGS